MKYPNCIKDLRVKAGLTQQELGLKFEKFKGLTVISRWERGVSRLSSNNLLEISRIFGVDPRCIYEIKMTEKSGSKSA